MGIPIPYADLFIPNFLLYFLTFLEFIRKFINAGLSFLGMGDFLEPETASYHDPRSERRSASAVLIREVLPVMKFSEMVEQVKLRVPENCIVCLCEFSGEDEIRRLTNCSHIFHRCCLDRWMDHDQKTCPLCRTQFIPKDMQEVFSEKLWVASGASAAEYLPIIPTGL